MMDGDGLVCEEGAVRVLLEWRVCHRACWCWEDERSAWVCMGRGGLLFIDEDCQSWDISGDQSLSAGDANGMCGFCWTDRGYGLVDADDLILLLLHPTRRQRRDLFSNSSQDLIKYRPIIKDS